jgi:hypothetical protein
MLHRITECRVSGTHRLWIRFEDGVSGEVDLSDMVGKGVFEAWSDHSTFEQVFIDEESGTVAWPGGIDLAPDGLYREVRGGKAA